MNFLTIENATKSYGEKILFDDIDLYINKGDKVALVAKNGTGKTTLLKVIAGETSLEGEHALIRLHKDVKTGYLPQDPHMPDTQSVLEYLLSSQHPKVRTLQAYTEALKSGDDEAIQKAVVMMDQKKAWDADIRLKEISGRLGIHDMDKLLSELSGGQAKRLALARLIFEDPEFLILDEPTNHLDLEMIEWLESYLSTQNRTLFMVTHDRYFLDRVCNQIVELEGGKLHKYAGNYSDYLEKRSIRLDIEQTVHDKNKKLLKKELDWVRRMPQARTTKSKARTDKFYELKEEVYGKRIEDELHIDIDSARLGSKIVELHNISKSFDQQIIFENFDYKFKKSERLGIIGKNGSGKTTLLKIITGQLRPDTGKVVIGDTVVFGHYTQEGITVDEDQRVIDVIRNIAEYLPLKKGKKLSAEQLLERFMFPRPQQLMRVSKLSGGEKRRLYLLTVLMANPNFLILDEPTNDLDILTLNVLESYLMDFPGCVIIVSHDRYFMDKLVDHLFVLEGNGAIWDFPGTYTEFRREVGTAALRSTPSGDNIATTKSENSSEREKKKAALTYFEKKELKEIDEALPRLEARKKEIMALFNESQLSPQESQELSEELGKVQEQLESSESRWLELMEKKEGN
ncbi:MAG: ABC-F family ATP-binding cassette domain-containing protein [Saprospiraceae bacterium]|nr:ABC-F family ATP-binding cassette domain-containing protein [Saprospiraceae bacterium]